MNDKVYVRVVSHGGELELKFATMKRSNAFTYVPPEAEGQHYVYVYIDGVWMSSYYWTNDNHWVLMRF